MSPTCRGVPIHTDQLEGFFMTVAYKSIETIESDETAVYASGEDTTRRLAPMNASSADPVRVYLADIAKAPLLTAAQEVSLAKLIERRDMRARNKPSSITSRNGRPRPRYCLATDTTSRKLAWIRPQRWRQRGDLAGTAA